MLKLEDTTKRKKPKRSDLVYPLVREKTLFIVRSVRPEDIKGLTFSNYMRFLSYQKSKRDKNSLFTDFCIAIGRDITASYYSTNYYKYKNSQKIDGKDF